MRYLYRCPACGEFESPISGDSIQCRCGSPSRRVFAISVNKASLQHQGRYDHVVGAYVRNEREFRDMVRQSAARESAELGMECKVEFVDARDREGLAETHGLTVDHYHETAEQTAKVNHDTKVAVDG